LQGLTSRKQGIIGAIVQCFFAWRVQKLTRKTAVTAVIVMLALLGAGAHLYQFQKDSGLMSWFLLGFSIGLAILLMGIIPHAVPYKTFQITSVTWLMSSALADVIIATVLIWYLVRIIT
jgi:hypothetical protein